MDKIVLSIFRHGSHFVYNILQSLFYYVDISNEYNARTKLNMRTARIFNPCNKIAAAPPQTDTCDNRAICYVPADL